MGEVQRPLPALPLPVRRLACSGGDAVDFGRLPVDYFLKYFLNIFCVLCFRSQYRISDCPFIGRISHTEQRPWIRQYLFTSVFGSRFDCNGKNYVEQLVSALANYSSHRVRKLGNDHPPSFFLLNSRGYLLIYLSIGKLYSC